MSKKWFLSVLLIAAMLVGQFSTAFADDGPVAPEVFGLEAAPEDVLVAPELATATGLTQVVIGMVDAPLAKAAGENAKIKGSALSAAQSRAYLRLLNSRQTTLLRQIAALGGVEIARLSKALNAVIVEIDASQLSAIAGLQNVASIRPVVNYELDLSETVPYIGAAVAQADGVDGAGVRVAVLDSGIDYTHFNLGGSGVVADFTNNDPTVIEPNSFPTGKVIGGYDFVGELWPNGPLMPDPDPLDKGAGAGHGTHVADIIAGKSLDGTHKGVAPGASLYGVGVCSKVSSSCSGVALLQGMEFALDPNMDGNLADAVDVINMSLGSSYGQRQDDLSFASANAVKFGVVVVVSAGNSGDKPYIVGSPSSTPEVISVAQTQVPSAKLYNIAAGTATVIGSWQAWSAAPTYVSGALAYDTTSTATRQGCNNNLGFTSPWAGTPFAGKILLVDRGTCAISIKVSNGAAAGALAVIIANNVAQAPGDLPPDFSYGGGTPIVAGYTVTQASGTLLKTQLGQTAIIDPAAAISLAGSMVSSSSRGPSYSFSAIKPDLGAPGASLSAQYGTGTGQTAFGGTSGAAPMVSGAAALVLQSFPGITPAEVKARLMNTGETNIGINPVSLPGYLAPITRIGGGEVRVDRALAATTAAWDADDLTGSLSFGYHALTGSKAFQKTVVVRNYSNQARTYTITPEFRYVDDAFSGAVTVSAPDTVRVKANSSATFNVKLQVDVTLLPQWNLNGGSLGGNGSLLQNFEFDGYIHITDVSDAIHLAWHILPHRSAEVTPATESLALTEGMGALELGNYGGAVDGRVEVFSLLGTSGRIPPPLLPGDGDNFAIIDLKSFGARLVSTGIGYGLQFAINTFGTRAHPNYPAEFDVYIDTNGDGLDDFVVYNFENGGFAVSGQNVVRIYNLNTGANQVFFYSDADLNSGNIILTVPLSFMGITPDTQLLLSVYAYDNYFTGWGSDAIEGMLYTPGAPKFYTDNWAPVVPMGGSTTLNVYALAGGETASPSQLGLQLLYRDSRQQREADAIYILP